MGILDTQEKQMREAVDSKPNLIVPAPMPKNPENDFFKYRIDSSDIIDEVTQQLRGYVWVLEDGVGKWVKKYEPIVNDTFINIIINLLYSCGLNKNIILGNLKTEQIDLRMKMLWKKLARLICFRYNNYGIKKEMRSIVIQTIVNPIHSGLSRCEGGKEAYQLSTASQMIIHRHESEGKQSSGFDFLNPFKNKAKT